MYEARELDVPYPFVPGPNLPELLGLYNVLVHNVVIAKLAVGLL